VAGAASTAYIETFKNVIYATELTSGGSGIMKALDWTYDKVKSADDYNLKMYAQTVYKYG
jgi:hypothetical protein